MDWKIVIGVIALLFSVISFYLFVREAMRKQVPDEVVAKAAKRAEFATGDLDKIGALAKALAEAFSKVGPAALALIGAILFLLLGGEALSAFDLTDAGERGGAPNQAGRVNAGNPLGRPATGNSSGETGNRTGNVQ